MSVHIKSFFCFIPLLVVAAVILSGCGTIQPGDGRITIKDGSDAVALSQQFGY